VCCVNGTSADERRLNPAYLKMPLFQVSASYTVLTVGAVMKWYLLRGHNNSKGYCPTGCMVICHIQRITAWKSGI
jgi:hypothetical protein